MKNVFLLLAAIVTLSACGDGSSSKAPVGASVASFAGIYSGTYSGADSGTVTVTIATNGSITGNGSSTTAPGEQFALSGQVTAGGNVILTGTSSAGTAKLTGMVTSQGVLAGTWSDDAAGTGAFTTQKQGATPSPTPVASFAGVYTGTYSGADSGTVTVTLGTNGSISGSGKSTVDPTYQFTISGQVADGGNVSLQGSGSAGAASFIGTVTSLGVLSGTWTNSQIGGGTFTTQKPTIIATTYSIAGKITTGGSPLAGATVTTSNGSATTNASGNYTISGLVNGSYTVTPTKTDYAFTPASVAVTVNGTNVTGKNFTGSSAAPAPTVTSINPAAGTVGDTVVINGTNFSSTAANNVVSFHGVTAVVTAASSTSLTVTVPAGATAGSITVTTAGGNASSASFTVNQVTAQAAFLGNWRIDYLANGQDYSFWTFTGGPTTGQLITTEFNYRTATVYTVQNYVVTSTSSTSFTITSTPVISLKCYTYYNPTSYIMTDIFAGYPQNKTPTELTFYISADGKTMTPGWASYIKVINRGVVVAPAVLEGANCDPTFSM